MQEIRRKKIESLIRETISDMMLRGEIKDPRINELVTITGASIAKDMRDAKVFVSIMAESEEKDEIIRILNHASGFVQKLLADRIRLRFTPRLRFVRDDSLETGFRINQILKDLPH